MLIVIGFGLKSQSMMFIWLIVFSVDLIVLLLTKGL